MRRRSIMDNPLIDYEGRWVLDQISVDIAHFAIKHHKSPEVILDELYSLDWDAAIQKAQRKIDELKQRGENQERERLNAIVRCNGWGCKYKAKRKNMIYLEISTHVISSGPYCKKHAKEALEKYNREYFHA